MSLYSASHVHVAMAMTRNGRVRYFQYDIIMYLTSTVIITTRYLCVAVSHRFEVHIHPDIVHKYSHVCMYVRRHQPDVDISTELTSAIIPMRTFFQS